MNTASRMESSGTAGKIQITRATYELIKDEFTCDPRGKVMVKGKGELETWYLEGSGRDLPPKAHPRRHFTRVGSSAAEGAHVPDGRHANHGRAAPGLVVGDRAAGDFQEVCVVRLLCCVGFVCF